MRTTECTKAEWDARIDLAAAYRLVDLHGWGENIFNHVAARVPDQSEMMLIKRHELTYREVTASNLVKVPIEGDLDEAAGVNRAGYVLHAGLMQARPDIGASLHLHTAPILAISARREGLRMLSQYALQFHGRIGYHTFEGITETLDERQRIAHNLGDGTALFLRHHGAVTVGRGPAQAFTSARYLVEACLIQVMAEAGGGEVLEIPEPICRSTVQQFKHHDSGRATADWPAYLRDLDERSPGFRN